MKNLLTAVLLAVVCFYSSAQKPPIKFGDVSIEDLKMSRYEKDTSASAVILCDFGVSTIKYNQSNDDWKITFERTQRIKILKKEGYAHVDFMVPLYHSSGAKEKLSGLKVITHNLENGKDVQTKMKSDGVFEEKYDQNLDFTKFTPANVKEGSIVEVTYKIDSDFLQYFRDWEFQSTIPVVWSEYCANIPEYFHYEKYTQGYVGLAINEKKDNIRSISITTSERSGTMVVKSNISTEEIKYTEDAFRWAAKDVPAFKEEPFMTTSADYLSKINFELAYVKFPYQPVQPIMGTWEDLNKSLLESDYFGLPINGSGFLKSITEEVVAGASTDQEKISKIYNYVKSNIEWNGSYRKYLESNFKKPLDEKKGTSAEINLLLVAMLQKAGIAANPVIISTRNNGFVRETIALSSQFNYVICQAKLDGKNILLDATDRMLPIHILPKRCLNGKGYIISKETPGWISIGAPKSKISASAEVMLTPEGQLKGKMTISNDGYFGYSKRKEYFTKGEKEYVQEMAHQLSWEVEKSEFENIENLGDAVKENYEFVHQDNFGNADVLYINPILYMRQDENPFKLETRLYPVDYGNGLDQTFICRLTIPEGFQTEELPASKVLALPNNAGKYVYSIQQMGNIINVTSMLSINQPLFTQDAYPNLREFYNLVVAKQAEQIVLKRKN